MCRVEYFSYEVKKVRLVYSGLAPSDVAKLLSLPFLNDEITDGDDYHGPFVPKIYSEVVMGEYGSIEDCPYTWSVIFTDKSCKGFWCDDAEEELKWLQEAIEKELGWNRRVEEQLKISHEVNHMEEVEKFLDDALKALHYHYFYGDLKFKYFFDTAKYLIDSSGLSEEKKEEQRHSFASSIVFSRGGVRAEEWNDAMESIDRIRKALRGQD